MSRYAVPSGRRDGSTIGHLRTVPRAVAATVLAVAAVVCVAAPPAAATALPARTAAERTIALAVERTLNSERSAHHLPALTMNYDLIMSARRHDVTMARSNKMSHQLPGEPFFATRMREAGYHWTHAGENIAWTTSMSESGVLALQKAMYGERPPNDGHRLNILSSHFREVGIDVYVDRAHHKIWMTSDFGRR